MRLRLCRASTAKDHAGDQRNATAPAVAFESSLGRIRSESQDRPIWIPGRTAASASNSQEIDLYVALQEGVYLYDAVNNRLAPIVAGDLRADALTPGQRGIDAKAPVQLIYVVDVHRLTHTAGFQEPGLQDPEVQKSYYFVDTGLIAGNVYLFAAAQGLAAWFHNCDKTGLAQRLGLRAEQRVLFAQSVGYPAKKIAK